MRSRPTAKQANVPRSGVGRARRAFRQPRPVGRRARRSAATVSVFGGRLPGRQVRRVARRLLVGRAWCSTCPAGVVIERPLHMLSALSPGGVDLGHALIVLEEGAEADAVGRDGQPRRRGRRAALRGHRNPRRPPGPAPLRQPAKLGHRRLALRPSAGPGGQGCVPAMDDRRPGQPAGQGESARGPGRSRRQRRGQRRDVHRRQAAPLLPHAATPPGARLHQRLALQGRPAGQVAAGLAGHDQGRPRCPTNRRLSAGRQPDPFGRRPGRLDSRLGNRGRRRQMFARRHGRPGGRRAGVLHVLPRLDAHARQFV